MAGASCARPFRLGQASVFFSGSHISTSWNRCNNCPGKGCADCPLFGVGNNPEYMKKKVTYLTIFVRLDGYLTIFVVMEDNFRDKCLVMIIATRLVHFLSGLEWCQRMRDLL